MLTSNALSSLVTLSFVGDTQQASFIELQVCFSAMNTLVSAVTDSSAGNVVARVDGVFERTKNSESVAEFYNQWSSTYETVVSFVNFFSILCYIDFYNFKDVNKSDKGYNHPRQIVDEIVKHLDCQGDKSIVRFLDIAAGTGLVGIEVITTFIC